jgi:hypothetical protein
MPDVHQPLSGKGDSRFWLSDFSLLVFRKPATLEHASSQHTFKSRHASTSQAGLKSQDASTSHPGLKIEGTEKSRHQSQDASHLDTPGGGLGLGGESGEDGSDEEEDGWELEAVRLCGRRRATFTLLTLQRGWRYVYICMYIYVYMYFLSIIYIYMNIYI